MMIQKIIQKFSINQQPLIFHQASAASLALSKTLRPGSSATVPGRPPVSPVPEDICFERPWNIRKLENLGKELE